MFRSYLGYDDGQNRRTQQLKVWAFMPTYIASDCSCTEHDHPLLIVTGNEDILKIFWDSFSVKLFPDYPESTLGNGAMLVSSWVR